MIEKISLIEESVFTNLIQNEVYFYIYGESGKEVLRTGRIINFSVRLPYVFFVIDFKNKHREYGIPQPFAFKWDGDRMIFSYQLNMMTKNEKVLDGLKYLMYDSESKLANRNLYIEPKNES